MLGNLLRLIHNDSDYGGGFVEEVLAHQNHRRLGAAKLADHLGSFFNFLAGGGERCGGARDRAGRARDGEGGEGRRGGARVRFLELRGSGGNDSRWEQLRKPGFFLSQPDTVGAVLSQLVGLVSRLYGERAL